MPASPTISAVDSKNGGDFVVTVAGSTGGASNQLYAQAVNGSAAAAEGSPLTGDGTINGNLDAGYYFLYVDSSLAGSHALSNILGPFPVSRASQARFEQILEAVQASLQAAIAGFTDMAAGQVYIRDEWNTADQDNWNVEFPALIISHGEPVNDESVVNAREDFVYLVNIHAASVNEYTDRTNTPRHLLWLERIERLFAGQRLSGATDQNSVPDVVCIRVTRPIVLDNVPRTAGGRLQMGYCQLAFKIREPRGI